MFQSPQTYSFNPKQIKINNYFYFPKLERYNLFSDAEFSDAKCSTNCCSCLKMNNVTVEANLERAHSFQIILHRPIVLTARENFLLRLRFKPASSCLLTVWGMFGMKEAQNNGSSWRTNERRKTTLILMAEIFLQLIITGTSLPLLFSSKVEATIQFNLKHFMLTMEPIYRVQVLLFLLSLQMLIQHAANPNISWGTILNSWLPGKERTIFL